MSGPQANSELSPIVAGAWRLAEWGWSAQQCLAWIEANLDLGISSFDHADVYGDHRAEALFGQALALAPGLRQRIQLVSRCGVRAVTAARPGDAIEPCDSPAAQLQASVEQALRALRTDHLDLLLIDCPDAWPDADELTATLNALRRSGMVRDFGVSKFGPAQLALIHQRFPLVTHQVELSPLQPGPLHDGTLDQCQALGLRPMIWSPMAGGRIFTGTDAAAQRVRDVLAVLERELGVAWVTLLMAWAMHHPSRPRPIIGTGRIEMSREAVAALDLSLDPQQWYRLWQAGAGVELA